MKKLFKASSLKGINDWMLDEGLLENDPERKALRQPLEEFTTNIAAGYRSLVEKDKKFTLPDAQVKKLKNPEKASDLWSEHVVLQGIMGITPDIMTEMFEHACDLDHEKRHGEAINVLWYLIYLNPYVGWFWHQLGRCWEVINENEHAIYAYSVAINCEPFAADLYRDAVRCLLNSREVDRALALLEFSIQRIKIDSGNHQKL
ncbi:MAG: hypothetical protein Q8K75_01490 [Chlamydiales bacterium]|nr:hypothetical protein [Chlamydiales bacterium]